MFRPLQIDVLQAADSRRGYLANLCATETAVYAIGGSSSEVTVLVSSDGEHFHSRETPDYGLRECAWLDGGLVVVGEFGLVARSEDEGATWTEIQRDDGCLFTICEAGGSVWIAGDNGRLMRLEGTSIEEVDSGTDGRIIRVRPGSGKIWLLCYDGALRTLDGECGIESRSAWTELVETPKGTLIAVGDGGQLARSTDGGQTFALRNLGAEDLESAACLADGRIVAVGGNGTVLLSEDDGLSFVSVPTEISATLWSVCAFGDGLLIGGDGGLVVRLAPEGESLWAGREDRFAIDHPLDLVFADGPDGFVGERLRAFVMAMNPDLSTASDGPGEEAAEEEKESPEEDDPETQGADAWKRRAIEKCRGLWNGTTADFEAVWGTAPSTELVAFEAATRGAETWRTFEELRLDIELMANPPPEANLFEMVVLSDQLNYLGTALGELFAGVTGFGSLGNGDTYHYDVYGDQFERTVQHWDHDDQQFAATMSKGLDPLVYLCALCRAVDGELVSDDAATAGYRSLRGKVAPSWHFSIEDHDEDFAPYEHPSDQKMAYILYWRAAWMRQLFRSDGIVGVSEVGEYFVEQLNGVIGSDLFAGRLEASKKYVSTSLYAMWRAYFFGEPELEQYLEVGRAHAGRLARDAARLIDELLAGRKELGKIEDMSRLVERFRALDLDPRRAEEREAERAAAEAETAAGAERVADGFASAQDPEAYLWEHVAAESARPALWESVLAEPGRTELVRGVSFLANGEYSRNNRSYRGEERDACAWVAERADSVVQALLVGTALHPAKEAIEGVIGHHHASEILKRIASAGRLDGRALPCARALVDGADMEDGPHWIVRRCIALLGLAGDVESVPLLAAVLAPIPDEGGFETSLAYDEFIGEVADSLRQIGSAAGAECLVRFAASTSPRMRKARNGAASALARLAPDAGSESMVANLVEMSAKVNDGEENSASLLAAGLIGRALDAESRSRLLAQIRETEPMAKSYVEVQLAHALARNLLGAGNDDEVATLLERSFTEPGWKEEYTVRRRHFALDVYAVLPSVDPSVVAGGLTMGDEGLSRRILEAVPEAAPPSRLTWFEAEKAETPELVAALADDTLGGRHHAARRLGALDEAVARGPLEAATAGVLARAPENAGAELPASDRAILRESVQALLAFPHEPSTQLFAALLSHPNRNVKDPVLRDPPTSLGLADAMRFVAAEKYGWQETVARDWLREHLS